MPSEATEGLSLYRGPLDFVLDIGAHVGYFALSAAKRGAKLIHAYEPHPKNFQILCQNIIKEGCWGTIIPFPYAVTTTRFESRILRQAGTNSGQHSTEFLNSYPGIEVPCCHFQDVILSCPTIDYLKIDIEGGEWELFSDPICVSDLYDVNYIDLELHDFNNPEYFDISKYSMTARKNLYTLLQGLGFTTTNSYFDKHTIWRNDNAQKT